MLFQIYSLAFPIKSLYYPSANNTKILLSKVLNNIWNVHKYNQKYEIKYLYVTEYIVESIMHGTLRKTKAIKNPFNIFQNNDQKMDKTN